MKLFDQKERSNVSYAKNKHNAYQFYDLSDMEQFAHVRERMNDWFSHYPISHRGQLKSDFKSQFDSAYFELFIHELFMKLGFIMEPHVSLPLTTKMPDFLGIKKGLEVLIEAKVATDMSEKDMILKERSHLLFDAINEIECKDFWLSIDWLEFKTSRNPKINAIKAYINEAAYQYREELINEENFLNNPDYIKKFFYSDECINLEFSLYPSSIEPDPFIVSQPATAFWGGSEESIRKAVANKANRYGPLDKPFIVCINATSFKHTTARDVFNAIFGYHQFSEDGIHLIKNSNNIGIFNSQTPKFTNVSAVFLTRTYPGNPQSTEHWLIENPSARNPIDLNQIDLSYSKLVDNCIVEVKKAGVPEIIFGNELKTRTGPANI